MYSLLEHASTAISTGIGTDTIEPPEQASPLEEPEHPNNALDAPLLTLTAISPDDASLPPTSQK